LYFSLNINCYSCVVLVLTCDDTYLGYLGMSGVGVVTQGKRAPDVFAPYNEKC
jgi:hypothetical protein